MVWDSKGRTIREDYDGKLVNNRQEKQWAGLLLAEKVMMTGGGMFSAWHRHALRDRREFRTFEKRWKAWWEAKGKAKYAKTVKESTKAFHKHYVREKGSNTYVPRWTVETDLTDNEIKWVKRKYREVRGR